MKFICVCLCLFFLCCWLFSAGSDPVKPNNLRAPDASATARPLSVAELNLLPGSAAPAPSLYSSQAAAASSSQSFQQLENNEAPGPDGKPNKFFYLPGDRVRRYASGPCRGYAVGEEWFCAEDSADNQ